MTTQISDYLTPDEARVANVYLAWTILNILLHIHARGIMSNLNKNHLPIEDVVKIFVTSIYNSIQY